MAYDPTSHAPVFVDGPYGSAEQAAASAHSLASVEEADSGGLYEVTAPLTSHLDSWVSSVAKCLDGTSGTGPLTY